MFHGLFAQRRNYALVLLFLALLTYSLIGFSIQVPLVQAQEEFIYHEWVTGALPWADTASISSNPSTMR